MRLAAIYIPENSLNYLFGDKHKGQTFNLGGLNDYKINVVNDEIKVELVSENENFISDFWGDIITNITVIVGRNGIGKTSILRAIHSTGDKKKKDVFYLFEGNDSMWYYNELEIKNINSDFQINELKALNNVKEYFTPIVDIHQLSTLSRLGIVSTGKENLTQLHNKQIMEDVILLNDPVIETLKNVYPDFPNYRGVEISITEHRKFDFKNVYATANLGNQDRDGVLKNYIESDLDDLEEGKWDGQLGRDFIRDFVLERYLGIIESNGLNYLFDQLWSQKEYVFKSDKDLLHGSNNFIRNFEVTLFSYFVLDATFPQTPYQGSANFQDILKKDTFKDRFNAFFDLYLINIYADVRDLIYEKLERISIEDYEEIKNIVEQDRHKKWTVQGFKSSDAIELMLRYLERFKAINDLYDYLEILIKENKFTNNGSTLIYNFNQHNESDFHELINLYNKVIAETSGYVYPLDLFKIRSDHPLSSGEKALLNFFARINKRINSLNYSIYPVFNYYLLLLDEPELGFHPLWKKKFINAITKSLPILYSKLEPNKNLLNQELENLKDLKIQIILSTHDPLTLSDFPQNNVIYLDKDKIGKTFINQNKVQSFGANIHDLLAQSFFLEDGLIGDFAQNKINEVIDWIRNNKNKDTRGDDFGKKLQHYKKLIEMIDERIIRIKLAEMISELEPEKDFYNSIIDQEIALLNKKRKR